MNVVPLSKLTGPGLHPGVTISISQQLQIIKSKMQSLVSGNPPLIHRTNSSVGRQRPVEVGFCSFILFLAMRSYFLGAL